jgi:hypothetical protein
MRKINFKNIALVIGVSIFDIAIGIYDRIVNNTGFLKGLSDWYSGLILSPVATSTQWNTSTVSLATSTQSSFSLLSVVLIVMAAVGVMGFLFVMAGSRAA